MREHDANHLRIGGITPLTTVDYPGQLAAVVFCQGCPWRCRYCQNGHLLGRQGAPGLDWKTVGAFLDRRQGLLDAVVFSGGEPTAQAAIGPAIRAVKRRGFDAGLHTSGAYPRRLAGLVDDLDWIGLDIKALPEDYPALTGVIGSGELAWQSLEVIQSSGIRFDVRVTVHDRLLPPTRLKALLARLSSVGVEGPSLQVCRSREMLDPALGPNSITQTELIAPATDRLTVR
jgi:pyruvate formate lyase activating enzyme